MRTYKTNLIFILVLISSQLSSFAQKNSITGTIIDSVSQMPLAYSTIKIINKQSLKLITGSITDSLGIFHFQNIPYNEYLCIVDYIGYSQKKISFLVEKSKNNVDLSVITLCPRITNLQEFEITGKGSIRTKADRVIYAIDSSMTANALTTLDIMKKIPDIQMDIINNSIGIKGNGNTLILINGVNRNGQVDIRSIKPEDIERVEIISNPSTGADSEIDGVINIILKANPTTGFNLMTELSYTPIIKSVEPLFMYQFGWKKIRLNINYFPSFKGFDFEKKTYRKNLINKDVSEFKTMSKNPYELTNIIRTGTDFYMTKSSFLNLSSETFISNSKNTLNTTFKNSNDEQFINSSSSINKSKSNYFLGNYTLFFRKSFTKDEQGFSSNFNFHHMIAEYDDLYNDEYLTNTDTILLSRKNNSIGKKTSTNLALEYTHPLTETIKIITGSLGYYQYFTQKTSTESISEFVNYSNLRMNYYLDVYFSLFTIDFRTGVKIENYSTFTNESNHMSQNSLLPSFIITKRLNNLNTLKLNYRTTAFYPSAWSISPSIIYYDSLNAFQGTPKLKPQTFSKYEISHIYRKKDSFVSTSIYYSKIENMFASISYINDQNFCLTKPENVSGKQRIGLNFTSSFLFFDKLEISPSLNIFNESFNNTYCNKSNNSYITSLTLGCILPKDLYLYTSASFCGKTLTLQGYYKPQYLIDIISLSKKILKGNGSIAIAYRNPLIQAINETVIESDNVYQIGSFKTNNNSVYFRFICNFTKGNKVEMKDVKKIMERDIK
jgi:ferric enterobactin receptor